MEKKPWRSIDVCDLPTPRARLYLRPVLQTSSMMIGFEETQHNACQAQGFCMQMAMSSSRVYGGGSARLKKIRNLPGSWLMDES
jgi:hypothetical protein